MSAVGRGMSTNPSYDVFVSYAHADNEVAQNSSAKFGWVTTLAENLNIGPNVHKKNLNSLAKLYLFTWVRQVTYAIF